MNTINKPARISVYGIGNFGFALLKHFDNKQDKKIKIKAFDRNRELIANLKSKHEHLYFHKNIKISPYIEFIDSPKKLLADCDIVILAVSSDATNEILTIIKENISSSKKIILINTAKALDNNTGKRLSEIVKEEMEGYNYSYSLLAGGTIAKDLFQHEPLGVDIASNDSRAAKLLAEVFSSNNLKAYPTTDLVGVEYASSLKNVVSILAGVVHGLGLSYGSETFVISKTAELIAEVCVKDLGAHEKTFSIGSQSWGNDLWMSCTGKTRNREFGILLGKGVPVDKALSQMAEQNKIVEGINTLKIINRIEPLIKIPPIRLLHDLTIEKNIDYAIFKERIFNNL